LAQAWEYSAVIATSKVTDRHTKLLKKAERVENDGHMTSAKNTRVEAKKLEPEVLAERGGVSQNFCKNCNVSYTVAEQDKHAHRIAL
jgi:hypothetical protein